MPYVVLGISLLALLLVIYALMRTFILVRQAQTRIVERLGKYHATLGPGLHVIVPFIDKVVANIDMREQVVVFEPQSVITRDNLVVSIDSVVYFQVANPERSTYEIQNYLVAIEQLSVTTLRNIIGALDLEQTLTSRDSINSALRTALDETTGAWGVRISRVELRSITPPQNVQQAMEAQMRAEREKRAAILTAEGQQASAVKVAEGERQSAVLRAEGERQSAILRAEGEAQAIHNLVSAIHESAMDQTALAYTQIKQWQRIAESPSNKLWILPQDLTTAASVIGQALSGKDAPAEGASFGAEGRRAS